MKIKRLIKSLYAFYIKTYSILYSCLKVGLTIGSGTRIHTSSYFSITYGGCIEIGSNCGIGGRNKGYSYGFAYPTRIFVGEKGRVSIGDNTNLNGINLNCRTQISIGENCRIASGVQITDCNGHEVACLNRAKGGIDNPKPIKIGNNVWIGLGAIILKGTKVGDNSIIAAGSVVKGEYPANVIISGNPAMISKIIEQLH